MEIALEDRVPTFSGGLGVLAGDTLRSCADLRVPVVGVTLLSRKGYFGQAIDPDGAQREKPASWKPEDVLAPLPATARIDLEGRAVEVRVWRHEILGADGYVVPVLFLDTDVPGNTEQDRHVTDHLYGGDDAYRLSQEIVLGIGGIRALKALGYSSIQKIHMNERHSSLAALELLRERGSAGEADFRAVRERCIFTTHTPVPAGHDRFDHGMVRRLLGEPVPGDVLAMLSGKDRLNMSLLALNLSRYVNGVARKHREVSEQLFPGQDIRHITNGVHSLTWTCAGFRDLFDRHCPGWREDPFMLRKVLVAPEEELWRAHQGAKAALLDLIAARTGRRFRPDLLTIGFARRATAYKRATLLFRDVERLRQLGRGVLQLVFAGKAHPADGDGKAVIRQIHDYARLLGEDVPTVFLPGYDLELAKALVSGVDVWLNTPLRPLEASGTSGMKAAHNGVPSLSVLDGWWVEGCVEGVTGWPIGPETVPAAREPGAVDADDAADLYRRLEHEVMPAFYQSQPRWLAIMKHCIALNASFFNSHRMVQQYVTNAYLP
ncbi:MAG: alpha-glucan family phosphorylase [Deltaproteobacteria bacterium]|nr:alpha-glucan family phosphorylase [Deltaproteobacteria bacterium]